ncbi:MAG TPA: phage major capsid protein [Isosphaeraceae bacterium]|nr:phage major capsid protein [Isosphaeraceae bacterium]
MGATLESLEPTLQRVYAPKAVQEQLYQENPFWNKVKRNTRFEIGETARVVLHDGRNGGYSVLPAGGGTLNEAGNQGFHKAQYKYKNHHQQVSIQGEVIDGASGDPKAIVDGVTVELDGAMDDLTRQLTRQCYLNGDALIAQCRASSSNNVDLNTTSGAIAIERGWLYVGLPVDVGSKTEQTLRVNGSKITEVDETNVAVKVASGNITTETTNDYISVKAARSGETSYEMNGLRNIVGTGELGELTSTTSPVWKATVNSTTTVLTLAALLEAQQKIRQRRGKSPNFFLTGLKQQRKFYELLQQQVNFTSDRGLTAGADAEATWNGMEIFGDPDCPDEDLYLGFFDHLFLVAQSQPYWQNKVTGGNILSWSQGTDAYVAKLTLRANLAVNRRNDMYRFSALT